MKKYFILLLSILMLCAGQVVFATDTKEYIEYSSGEKDDGSIYLDSYEDYLKALGNVDEQEVYKEQYLSNLANAVLNYDLTERPDVVKARVLNVEGKKEYYSYDSYGLSKISYQPVNVQVLEGKHKGETYDISYILTADSYENLKVKELKANQKINIVISESGDESYAYATTVDSAVNRVPLTVALIIVAVLLMIVYLGKQGMKIIPQMILLADMVMLVLVPELFAGRSLLLLTIVTSILYIIVESVIKVGLNSKAVAAIFSTIVVTLALTVVLVGVSNIANFSGITYEVLNMLESFPKGTIDFYMLYMSSFILLCMIVTSNISCMAISANGDKKVIKENIAEKLPLFIGILFVSIIPKYLYLLISKYTYDEIINSEMLLTDVYKIMFLIIAMGVTVQITEYAKKLFVDEK